MADVEDTSNFCLFCYRVIQGPNLTSNSVKTFIETLTSLVGSYDVYPILDLVTNDTLFQSCRRCKDILDTFCATEDNVVRPFLCSQLAKIIINADKVPARWRNVNRVTTRVFKNNPTNKVPSQYRITKFRESLTLLSKQNKLQVFRDIKPNLPGTSTATDATTSSRIEHQPVVEVQSSTSNEKRDSKNVRKSRKKKKRSSQDEWDEFCFLKLFEILRDHPIGLKYGCKTCDRRFTTKARLFIHIRKNLVCKESPRDERDNSGRKMKEKAERDRRRLGRNEESGESTDSVEFPDVY